MALYEWQDGKIGMACVHGGDYTRALFATQSSHYMYFISALLAHSVSVSQVSVASLHEQTAVVLG